MLLCKNIDHLLFLDHEQSIIQRKKYIKSFKIKDAASDIKDIIFSHLLVINNKRIN